MPISRDSASDRDRPNTATPFNASLGHLFANDHENERQRVDWLFMVILTLCPFSFCAYTDPNPNHGWMEFTEDGCIVQHLSWDCLKRHFKEVLRIVLERARNLPVTNKTNVRSGQYFVFSTGSSRERSEDKWNERNPGWNKSHYLLIKKHCQEGEHYSKLRIELYNSDAKNSKNNEPRFHKSTGKKCLGSNSIPLSEVLKDEETYHAPRIAFRESNPSDRDTVVNFHTQRLSLDNAWREARKNVEPADAWDQPMPKSKKAYDWPLLNGKHIGDFKPVGFINAVKRGTQVWVYADQQSKTIAIAFRGTEKTKLEDIRTVFQIQPSKLHWESTGNCKLNSTLDQKDNGMRLHAGFLKSYDAVRIALLEMVYSITEWSEEWTICLTGHSLGGALAALCSFHYVHLTDEAGKRPKVFMMSFGAPRVGNKAFIGTFKKTVEHGYRVACGTDIICKLPLHFHHVGLALQFDKNGSVRLNKKLIANVEVDVACIEMK